MKFIYGFLFIFLLSFSLSAQQPERSAKQQQMIQQLKNAQSIKGQPRSDIALQKRPVESWSEKVEPVLYLHWKKQFAPKKGVAQKTTPSKASATNTIELLLKIQPGGSIQLDGFTPRLVSPNGDLVIGSADLEKLPLIARQSQIKRIEWSRKRKRLNNSGRVAIRADSVHLGLHLPQAYQGQDVIVGVIDSGIDFTHPDFNGEDGTRILHLLEFTAAGTAREWNKSHIDESPGSIVQLDGEGALGHGTHVTGTAAGSGRGQAQYTGIAPKADIIFVKGIRDDDSDGGFEDNDVIFGVNYIFEKASILQKPAVVNLSLGGSFGPLDGTSLFEQFLDQLTGVGKVIVAAAGNAGFDFIHAGTTTASSTDYFTFVIPNWDIFMFNEIWYTAGDLTHFKIMAADVDGEGDVFIVDESAWIPVGSVEEEDPIVFMYGDEPVGFVYYDASNTLDSENGDGQILILVNDDDIAWIDDVYWMIAVRSSSSAEGRFDMIHTMGTGFPFELGMNGFTFVPADNFYSTGAPSTAKNIISTGAFVSKTSWEGFTGATFNLNYPRDFFYEQITPAQFGERAYFSSIGPTRDGRIAPDISAPGDIIFSALSSHFSPTAVSSSVRSSDNLYYGTQGTSMASPHMAGTVALMLEANPQLDYTEIIEILKEATIRPGAGTFPNVEFGYGRLNALKAVQLAAQTGGVSIEEEPFMPGEITLHPNFPNPFNPSTTLSFTLGNASRVNLDVYDVLGRKVATLLNNATFGSGRHSIQFDASRLSSGVYLYRLQADGRVLSGRMTLLK